MPLLNKFINHIHEQRKNASPELKTVLTFVEMLLHESNDGRDEFKLYQVLNYLESLKIKRLFKTSTTFEEILKGQKFPTIGDKNVKAELMGAHPTFFPLVSEGDLKVLGTIHTSLYRIASMPNWSYYFPIDQDEIQSVALQEWTEGFKTSTANAAVVDFARKFTVQERSTDNLESLKKNLDQLNANFSEDKQRALTAWILAHGGQEMITFLTPLFSELNDSAYRFMYQSTENLMSDWKRNAKHHPYFEVDQLIYDLISQKEPDCFVAFDENGIEQIVDAERLEEIRDYYKDKRRPPLARIYANVELTIDGEVIKPKFSVLEVISFTDRLKSPDMKQLELNERDSNSNSAAARKI